MFDIKILIILIAALVLVGPDKLPEIARTVGKVIRMFTAAKEDMERTIKADMFAGDEATKSIPQSGATVASTLYDKKFEDDDEEEEEE